MTKITKLTKQDFDSILDNYNIGKYKKHKFIFTGGNTVYKLKTTKGDFILKIYETASLDFVNYQIKLMEFLKKSKVTTPKIIDTKKKKGLLIWKKKRIAIQEYIEGNEVKYVNEKFVRDMAKKFSILDKTISKFKERKQDVWKNHQFKLVKWKKRSLEGLDLMNESKNLLKEIKTLNKKKLRRSLIHGDLCESNFLVKNNKVSAIFDWDDVHKDYVVYELAVPIAHIFITLKMVRKNLLKIFLKEYQKHITLNNEEKKALYLFVKHRELSAGYWCYNLIQKHKNQKKSLMKWTKTCIQKYKIFNKMPLEEFIKLF